MKLSELVPAIEDAASIEIEKGKRYVIFIDPDSIDWQGLAGSHVEDDLDCVFVACRPAPGQGVRDAVAAYKVDAKESA